MRRCGDIVGNKYIAHSAVPQDASFKGSIAAINYVARAQRRFLFRVTARPTNAKCPKRHWIFWKSFAALSAIITSRGLADYEIKDAVIEDTSDFRDWYSFNELGRLVTYGYEEVEKESFGSMRYLTYQWPAHSKRVNFLLAPMGCQISLHVP